MHAYFLYSYVGNSDVKKGSLAPSFEMQPGTACYLAGLLAAPEYLTEAIGHYKELKTMQNQFTQITKEMTKSYRIMLYR